jgi:hypothetical protein
VSTVVEGVFATRCQKLYVMPSRAMRGGTMVLIAP